MSLDLPKPLKSPLLHPLDSTHPKSRLSHPGLRASPVPETKHQPGQRLIHLGSWFAPHLGEPTAAAASQIQFLLNSAIYSHYHELQWR